MNLNDQIRLNQTVAKNTFVFKQNVKFKHMTDDKQPMIFRVLPAFNPADTNPETSFLPFVLPDGQYTSWGLILHVARFVGHGAGPGGQRRDILSLKTFSNEIPCPVYQLLETIQNNQEDWGYLLQDKQGANGKIVERKAIGRPTPHFIMNIVELNQIMDGAKIGVFTASATASLIDTKTGLIFQLNALPDEVVSKNYLLRYAVTDLTHPQTGPALICVKGTENGEYSRYSIVMAKDNMGKPIHRDVTSFLKQRYDMSKPETFINVPTPEDIINIFISLFNRRSPAGYHEYALLKMAFPDYRIPDPPAAPAATNTVQGFTPQMLENNLAQTTPNVFPQLSTQPTSNTLAQMPQQAPAFASSEFIAQQALSSPVTEQASAVVAPGDINAKSSAFIQKLIEEAKKTKSK